MNTKFTHPFITIIAFIICFSSATFSQTCSCWQHRDSTFNYVPFKYCTSECGSMIAPYYRNDDAATDTIILPFQFCFGGIQTDSVFINTNGNLTFGRNGAQFTTFSPDTFPQLSSVVPPMIAPFWGDVDDVNGTGGTDEVIYKITPHHIIVQWDSVGYFDRHLNRTNSFQVIISDGTDSIIPNGNNVEFCYQQMQWTTGDASSGVNGFGGDPATVGVNLGDGINFEQVGLFDTATAKYLGQFPPAPGYDGVGWLDNKMFYFNTCNLPFTPMYLAITPCDTIYMCVHDSAFYPALVLTSQQHDTVESIITSVLPTGLSLAANIPGHIDSLSFKAVGSLANVGYHTVTISSFDKNNPVDTGHFSFVLNVQTCTMTSTTTMRNNNGAKLYPNPNNGGFTLEMNSPAEGEILEIYDTYGRKILDSPLSNTDKTTVDLKNVSSGMYFYRIVGMNGEILSDGKFVVQK